MQHNILHPSTPQLMGILNVTPDSYFTTSRVASVEAAIDRAAQMIEEGAEWIDVGGESTRPGAQPITEQEELDRVIPIVDALHMRFATPLSIDTSKAAVMTESVKAGASMINDVWGLRQPGALEAAAATTVPVCIMHMQGEPRTMQDDPHYADNDVIGAVIHFFADRINACEKAGIHRERLILDPGIGFGKTLQQNLQLINRLGMLINFNLPLLVGVSRKSMIGQLLDKPVQDRLFGSIAAALVLAQRGAHYIRTHDIGVTREVLRVGLAIEREAE